MSVEVISLYKEVSIHLRFLLLLYGPHQAKQCLQTCTKCADSDHPVHEQSISLTFALIEIFCSIQ